MQTDISLAREVPFRPLLYTWGCAIYATFLLRNES